MKLSIKLVSLIVILMLIVSTVCVAFSAEDEFETIEFFSGEETENEEKEYIVRFNDDVVTLYAEEGKDYALMGEDELNAAIEEGIVEFYEENSWVYLYEETEEGGYDPMQASYKWDVKLIKTVKYIMA